jgi:hypothetical protein
MKDREAPVEDPPASDYAVYAYGGFLFLCVVGVWRHRTSKRRKKSEAHP